MVSSQATSSVAASIHLSLMHGPPSLVRDDIPRVCRPARADRGATGNDAMGPSSPRLLYRRVVQGDAGRLHVIATEPFVRRWLLDGETVAPEWGAREIAESDALFERIG